MGRLLAGTLVIVLVLFAPHATAWNQLAGGAERAGVAVVDAAPLDVVSTFRFLDEGEVVNGLTNAGLVQTPHGLMLLANRPTPTEGECTRVTITDLRNGTVARDATNACEWLGAVGAYDPSRDVLLECRLSMDGTTPVLRAVDAATGEERWTVVPARDLLDEGSPSEAAVWHAWYCLAPALDKDAGHAIVVFSEEHLLSGTRHRVARVNLETGAVEWSTRIPTTAFATKTAPPAEEVKMLFTPTVPTLTGNGILVAGIVGCRGCATPEQAYRALTGEDLADHGPEDVENVGVAWLDMEGNLVGTWSPFTDEGRADTRQGQAGGSFWATSNGGGLGALGSGRHVVIVDPSATEPAAVVPLEAPVDAEPAQSWPAPRWHKDVIVVPRMQSVSAFQYGTEGVEQTWTWQKPGGWTVADTLVVAPDDLLILASRTHRGEGETVLFRTTLSGNREVQAVPLPIDPHFRQDGQPTGFPWRGRLLPLEDGLLVWDTQGQAVWLGEADPALVPDIRVSNAYPRAGEEVTVEIGSGRAEDMSGAWVRWGDGGVQATETRQVSRTFTSDGVHVVHVTVLYDDGRTGTAEAVLEVGGTPPTAPPELNFMQRAFAPERLDTTWGVIGLGVTLVGAMVTLIATRVRRSRLARALQAVERTREAGVTDPLRALRSLAAFAKAQQVALERGRWSDAQFSVLFLRLDAAAHSLRLRLLAPFEDRLTSGFRQLLEAALKDGIVRPEEAAVLRARLADEPALTEADRVALERLLHPGA